MADNHKRPAPQHHSTKLKKHPHRFRDTRVNIGSAFESWRTSKAEKGLRSDAELAVFLLDGMKGDTSTPDCPATNDEKKPSLSEVQALVEQEVHRAVKKREIKLQDLIGSIQQQDRAVDYEGSIRKLEARINMVARRAEAAAAYMTKTKNPPSPSLDNVSINRTDLKAETTEAATPTDKKSTNRSGEIFKMMETTKKSLNEMRANNEALKAAIADLSEELPPPALHTPQRKGLKRPLKVEPEHQQDNTEESKPCEEPPAGKVKVECLSPGSKDSAECTEPEQLLYPPLPTNTLPTTLNVEAASYSLPQRPELRLALIRKPPGLSVLWNEAEKDPRAPPMDSYRVFMAVEKIKGSNIFPDWNPLGEVKAIPLPMCVMISKYKPGHKVCVTVVGKDQFGRYGPYSKIANATISD